MTGKYGVHSFTYFNLNLTLLIIDIYSYHKQHGIYYFNTYTKFSQWDHPLDVEYKKLVNEARAKLAGFVDQSEESSQIDSGIKSMQINENSELSLDATIRDNVDKDNFNAMEKAGGNFRKGLQLRPLLDAQGNARLEAMTKRSPGLTIAQDKIDLTMTPQIASESLNNVTISKNRNEPVQGLTLSGKGSMFLKSNTQKLENKESLSSAVGFGVKGILRDSSLTDIRNKNVNINLDEVGATAEDRKSVRFNLERSVQMAYQEKLQNTADIDEIADADEWDFTEDEDVAETYVKNIKVLNKTSPAARPSLKTQLSLDAMRKPPQLSRMAMLHRNFSTDMANDRENLTAIFDRKIEKNAAVIKPLYENSDSETSVESTKEVLDFVKDRYGNSDQINQQSSNMPLEVNERNIALEDGTIDKLETLKSDNKILLEKLLLEENERFNREKLNAIQTLQENNKIRLKSDLIKIEKQLNNDFEAERLQINEKHQRDLQSIAEILQESQSKLESDNYLALSDFEQSLKDEFDAKRIEISNKHRASVQLLQRNHTEILQDLERDLKTEEELVKKEHNTNLSQLKDKLAYELESEKQRMRETGDYHVYEKLRCEKRLLEDKYKCLKEKYIRLKSDVKITLERRNHRRTTTHHSGTTGSETERSFSNQQPVVIQKDKKGMSVSVEHGKPPTAPQSYGAASEHRHDFKKANKEHQAFGAAAKYISHLQQHHDDTTSYSQSETTVSHNYERGVKYSSEAANNGDNGNSESDVAVNRRAPEHNNNSRDIRKKLFTRMKSASTSRLNCSHSLDANAAAKPCTPIENLRKQLKKLEDLEDNLPENALDTTYHLRYPFKDINTTTDKTVGGSSSEFEFFKHRIHMERDSMRRAKEALRIQRCHFRLQKTQFQNKTDSISDRVSQKDLTELEVSLYKRRALLGEKEIRLRHLEEAIKHTFQIDELLPIKPDTNKLQLLHKDDATVSDLSSHSSSGFSSTDYGGTVTNDRIKRNDLILESTTIMESLEHLNAEIKDIWEILRKQRNQGEYLLLILTLTLTEYLVRSNSK